MASFVTWPANAKQKAEKFSNVGFFYTGKSPFINKSIFVTGKIFSLKAPNGHVFYLSLQERKTSQSASIVA
jgi:hypothetical protein